MYLKYQIPDVKTRSLIFIMMSKTNNLGVTFKTLASHCKFFTRALSPIEMLPPSIDIGLKKIFYSHTIFAFKRVICTLLTQLIELLEYLQVSNLWIFIGRG